MRVLPCILVTADATEELIRQALNAHVYSVIPKPVSKTSVLLHRGAGPGTLIRRQTWHARICR